MITNTQLKILEQLKTKKSTTEIKAALKIKSQSLVPNYLKTLEKNDLIIKTKIANINLYQINKTPEVFNYLEISAWENLPKEPKRILKEIANITNDPIIIFGSYAKKTNTKNSDLDIAIISNNKNLNKELEEIELKSIIPLDVHIISKKELEEMLNASYENLGKEILRNHLALTNSKELYALVNHQNII